MSVARIFAPPAFFASEVSPRLLDAMYALGEDVIVLLEFISPGPDGRQVDLAILGPNGVDIVEVKNKHGTVIASDHGPWRIKEDRGGETEIPLNTFRGRRENPWEQAQNTAKDFESGIKTLHGYPSGAKVFPAVLVPERRPQARLDRRQFVNGINGVEDLPNRLRSLHVRGQGEVWSLRKRVELAERLELAELGIAVVSGEVVDAVSREPWVGARVHVGTASVAADDAGRFTFAVPAGTHSVRIEVPGLAEPVVFDKDLPQGATSEWSIPISRPVESSSQPGASQVDVEKAIEDFSSKLDIDRAEREALFDLITETLARVGERSAARVEPDPGGPGFDAVLVEIREIRRYLEQARSSAVDDEGAGTIERGMQLVLALEKARVQELAVPIKEAAPGSYQAGGVATRPADGEIIDVDVRTQPLESRGRPSPRPLWTARRSRRAAWVAGGLLVVSFAVGAWWWRGNIEPTTRVDGQQPGGTAAVIRVPATTGGERTPVVPGVNASPTPSGSSAATPSSSRLPGVPVGLPADGTGRSASPIDQATCPPTHPVKGNVSASGERIFHVRGQEYYAVTHPEVCFRDAESARAEGFRASLR